MMKRELSPKRESFLMKVWKQWTKKKKMKMPISLTMIKMKKFLCKSNPRMLTNQKETKKTLNPQILFKSLNNLL